MSSVQALSSTVVAPRASISLSGVRRSNITLRSGARRHHARVSTAVRASQQQQQQDPTMALNAAQQRWESSLREGRIKNVTAKDASQLVKDGWVLLDVRPPSETSKVAIKDAVTVPLFVVDDDASPGTLLKQATAFGMGGWWLGGAHMKPNETFLSDVQAQIPKDAKVVVGCQKGLRSLAACEGLSRAGYPTIAWINGGFDTAKSGEFETASGKDVRYAGIGGLSELLGWTEVQQTESAGFAGGFQNIIKVLIVVVVLDALLFAYEVVTATNNVPQ